MNSEKKELKKADRLQKEGLRWFAAKMLVKLQLRNKRVVEAKGTKAHPDLLRRQEQGPLLRQKKEHDIWWYYRRLRGETTELQSALKRHRIHCNEKTRDAVISEACDVANFAAAIAEKAAEDTR